MIRDDLSDKLIHLTRGGSDQEAADAFLSIINERALKGGCGNIKGGFRCVCFSEAPVSKLGHILAAPTAHRMRYRPFGIMVSKQWLFNLGGRPVIYQTDAEYAHLVNENQYRHVRYDPISGVDFTWEREWRIHTDALALESQHATVVVPNRLWAEWFYARHMASISRRAIVTHGFIGPATVARFPWHFIALEDLGVSIPAVAPPPAEGIVVGLGGAGSVRG